MKLSEDTQIAITYATENERKLLEDTILNAGFLVHNHVALINKEEALGLNKNIKVITINDVIFPLKPTLPELYEYTIENIPRVALNDIPKMSHRREFVPRINKRNNFKKKRK